MAATAAAHSQPRRRPYSQETKLLQAGVPLHGNSHLHGRSDRFPAMTAPGRRIVDTELA
jgi:hypothetical protein